MTTPTSPDVQRARLEARIATLRAVLDLLWAQVEADKGEPFRTIGRAKVELIYLERELYALNRRQGEITGLASLPAPLPVCLSLAGRTNPPPDPTTPPAA